MAETAKGDSANYDSANYDSAIKNRAKKESAGRLKKAAGQEISDRQIDREADGMKGVFDAMEKVEVRIPRLSSDPNRPDPNDAIPVPVTVNGYTYRIKRGETVAVPPVFRDILQQSGYLG